MTIVSALYILLGLAALSFFVWLLVTFVAKTSPGREIVIGVAVILFLLVVIHYYAAGAFGAPALPHGR